MLYLSESADRNNNWNVSKWKLIKNISYSKHFTQETYGVLCHSCGECFKMLQTPVAAASSSVPSLLAQGWSSLAPPGCLTAPVPSTSPLLSAQQIEGGDWSWRAQVQWWQRPQELAGVWQGVGGNGGKLSLALGVVGEGGVQTMLIWSPREGARVPMRNWQSSRPWAGHRGCTAGRLLTHSLFLPHLYGTERITLK